MPWIRQNGHRIDWDRQRFRTPGGAIAAAKEASSDPTTTPKESRRAMGNARSNDEGVCVKDAFALPQCKLASLPVILDLDTAGKHDSSLENKQVPTAKYAHRDVASNPFVRASSPNGACNSSAIEAATNDGVTEGAARTELTDDNDATHHFARASHPNRACSSSAIEAAAGDGATEVVAGYEMTQTKGMEDNVQLRCRTPVGQML
ncbi:hypothetical protein Pst134EA_008992 [Puccinia striiformis f. sp. tritici]|nr:hypothetical protein Pst134EA_008992 [Puccinia striiformis f. sp. tritici]KAH9468448.1 hypothetical protein Pst134EA_008992 [Puccinia striiformis f. sp. tritici]